MRINWERLLSFILYLSLQRISYAWTIKELPRFPIAPEPDSVASGDKIGGPDSTSSSSTVAPLEDGPKKTQFMSVTPKTRLMWAEEIRALAQEPRDIEDSRGFITSESADPSTRPHQHPSETLPKEEEPQRTGGTWSMEKLPEEALQTEAQQEILGLKAAQNVSTDGDQSKEFYQESARRIPLLRKQQNCKFPEKYFHQQQPQPYQDEVHMKDPSIDVPCESITFRETPVRGDGHVVPIGQVTTKESQLNSFPPDLLHASNPEKRYPILLQPSLYNKVLSHLIEDRNSRTEDDVYFIATIVKPHMGHEHKTFTTSCSTSTMAVMPSWASGSMPMQSWMTPRSNSPISLNERLPLEAGYTSNRRQRLRPILNRCFRQASFLASRLPKPDTTMFTDKPQPPRKNGNPTKASKNNLLDLEEFYINELLGEAKA
ncbi:unnamed protein product [Cyprideis torosa]|uniref:Uncharacterized protein n=1 Tax=Cyprideis torosa TaxID=163714 RepID=A0A7R8WAX6_9CRUS|nr:unnamed protein product [Cyprideis torosa]CAG0891599.1 unnamed protein product [Cyprideis torosa]